MKTYRPTIRFAFALAIILMVVLIPQITNSSTNFAKVPFSAKGEQIVHKVFINQPITGIQPSKSCDNPADPPIVGMSITSINKNDARARNINPLISAAFIDDIYRCEPYDFTNPGCSQPLLWKHVVDSTAYYRDVVFSARVVISNPSDSEVFSTIYTRPDGSTFGGGTATYYNNFNGQQSCFVFSDGSFLCNFEGVLYNDFFFISQCKLPGEWKVELVKGQLGSPLNLVDNRQFTLAPEIGKPLEPFNQGVYPQQYGTFCHDPNNRHIQFICGDPNYPTQDITTIAQYGCTITALAIALRYYDVPATPDDLNRFFTNNQGYDPISGEIHVEQVPGYAFLKGVPGNISSVMALAPNQNHVAEVCSFGPDLIRVSNNTHMLTTYGFEDNGFGVLIPKIINPNGGSTGVYTPAVYNAINYFVRITGREFTFTHRAMSFKFYSPVEVFITDPLGRKKGLDPRTNVTYDEIPYSFYGEAGTLGPDVGPGYHPPKVLSINAPVDGEYTLTVIGTDNGTYRASFSGFDDQATPSHTYLPNLPITPGLVHSYKINYAGAIGSQLQIAANFDGGGQRPRDVNKFLTYINPSASSISLPAGTTTFPLLIIYNKNIVDASFKADLNGTDVTSMFSPTPGNLQSVNLPLQSGTNVLKLSVDGNLPGRVATDNDRLVFKVQ